MTSVFDGLARIIEAYRNCFTFEDYMILSEFVQAVHTLQHQEGTHRMDTFILKRIVPQKRFHKWVNPYLAEKLAEEIRKDTKNKTEKP